MHFPIRSDSFTTTHLWFTVRATTPLVLDEYSGGLLRGSFFHAIWSRFCANMSAPSCAACPLNQSCPVSTLVAPLREDQPGGQDIPRPYVMIPPLEGARRYQPGEHFSFGLTLIGSIVELLPYILLSIPHLETGGVGQRLSENSGQRGRFQIELVESYHPFTGQRQTLYQHGDLRVQASVITVQPQDSLARAACLNKEQLTFQFVTPLRLVYREHLVATASFTPLVQRLLERYLALERHYGSQEISIAREDKIAWLQQADRIQCSSDQTRWQELQSHSSRQKRTTPIGGLLGSATFVGNLEPFLDLLVIGELIHVGKDIVKGNGCYKISVDEER